MHVTIYKERQSGGRGTGGIAEDEQLPMKHGSGKVRRTVPFALIMSATSRTDSRPKKEGACGTGWTRYLVRGCPEVCADHVARGVTLC